MKICYIDESYDKNKRFVVVAAIMFDITRMKKTKTEWNALLTILSKHLEHNLEEIHTTDLYRGLNIWKKIPMKQRFKLIDEIIKYINERKHKILFSAVDSEKLSALEQNENFKKLLKCKGLYDSTAKIEIYRLAAIHLALCVQKLNMNEKNNKGDSLLIFDGKDNTIIDLIWNLPTWAHEYYLTGKEYKKITLTSSFHLPNIVDVPYHADSKKVLAINIADFYAYFLVLYTSLKEGIQKPDSRFDEIKQVTKWIQQMAISFVDDSNRWVMKGRNNCEDLFYQIAPDALKTIKKDMKTETVTYTE